MLDIQQKMPNVTVRKISQFTSYKCIITITTAFSDGVKTKCGSEWKLLKAFHIQTIVGLFMGGGKGVLIMIRDLKGLGQVVGWLV